MLQTVREYLFAVTYASVERHAPGLVSNNAIRQNAGSISVPANRVRRPRKSAKLMGIG